MIIAFVTTVLCPVLGTFDWLDANNGLVASFLGNPTTQSDSPADEADADTEQLRQRASQLIQQLSPDEIRDLVQNYTTNNLGNAVGRKPEKNATDIP